MSVTLRPVEAGDIDSLCVLEQELFGPDAWSREVFSGELEHPFSHYLIADDDGVVVGYAGLRAAPEKADQGDIQTIAVIPGSRSQGVGRLLLRTLIDEAQRRGVSALFLEVRADNPVAIELYRSEGFHEIDRRSGYYQPDGVDAVVMVTTDVGEAR